MFLEAIVPSTARRVSGRRPHYLQERTLGAGDVVETPRQSVAGRLLSWQVHAPQYAPSSLGSFVHIGWRRNPVFRRCVDILSSAACQGALDVVDVSDGQSLATRTSGGPADEAARRLLALVARGGRVKPVPGLSGRVLLGRLYQDMFVFGNAFWEKVRSRSGRVVELWRLDPRNVAVEPDPRTGIRRYLYNAHGTWWPLELRDVIHVMCTDPEQPYFGVPPIYSAFRDLQVDNELVDMFKVTLENFAVPPAVIETELGDYEVDDAAIERARDKWEQRYGRGKRGKVAILPGGAKVKVIGMNFKELEIASLVTTSETRIAMVHGVPMILLGRSGTQADPTRANYAEAKEHLWLDTVVPLQLTVAELLTIGLLPDFIPDGSAAVAFDNAAVGILRAAQLRSLETASKVFAAGAISRHVAQQMAGVETHGPDVFYRSGVDGIIPASATIETMDELEPLTSAGDDEDDEDELEDDEQDDDAGGELEDQDDDELEDEPEDDDEESTR